MKIVGLLGTHVGSSARTTIKHFKTILEDKYSDASIDVVDLAHYNTVFSDGRNYLDYTGDTLEVTTKLMEADVIIIVTPIFQASIPGILKNVFDLLPLNAFEDKVLGVISLAGSEKHYLVVEQQLKPILSYLKAQLVQSYVFITHKDMVNNEIVNQDIINRLHRLADDVMERYYASVEIIRRKEAQFDF